MPWLWILFSALLGCAPEPPLEPMLDEDICSRCRMAVSQRPFAAQAVSAGRIHFFDDIGCLVRWMAEREPNGVEAYVVGYESGRWLPAGEAAYVRSQELATPMDYGLAAFAEAGRAREFARRRSGEVLTWARLRREVE